MKTKTEIINETIQYYSEDTSRRSKNDGDCSYFKKNKMCAVGRCLIDPMKIEKEMNIAFNNGKAKSTSVVAVEELFQNFDDLFQEEYQGHNVDFWQCLQGLHDCDLYWNDEGLTEIAKSQVQFLLGKYKGQ